MKFITVPAQTFHKAAADQVIFDKNGCRQNGISIDGSIDYPSYRVHFNLNKDAEAFADLYKIDRSKIK